MLIELNQCGLFVEKQKPINVYYEEKLSSEYYADLIVGEKIIIELKAAELLIE